MYAEDRVRKSQIDFITIDAKYRNRVRNINNKIRANPMRVYQHRMVIGDPEIRLVRYINELAQNTPYISYDINGYRRNNEGEINFAKLNKELGNMILSDMWGHNGETIVNNLNKNYTEIKKWGNERK